MSALLDFLPEGVKHLVARVHQLTDALVARGEQAASGCGILPAEGW
jgi:hypothetical protein